MRTSEKGWSTSFGKWYRFVTSDINLRPRFLRVLVEDEAGLLQCTIFQNVYLRRGAVPHRSGRSC